MSSLTAAPSYAAERRAALRWPASVAHFRLGSETTYLRPELLDFNAQGIAFRATFVQAPSIGDTFPMVIRTEALTPFAHIRLRATHVVRSGDAFRVGGSIQDMQPASREEAAPHDDSGLVPFSAADATQILRGVQRDIVTNVWFTSPNLRLALPVQPAPESGDPTAIYVALPTGIALTVAVTGRVHFAMHGASLSAECTLRRDAVGRACIALGTVVSVSRRRCDRVMLQPSEATIRWAHPLDPAREVSARVHDLSPEGVGVAGPILIPPPGLARMTLDVGGDHYDIEGEVRHLTCEGGVLHIGIRTTFIDSRDRMRIAHFCRGIRFPRLLPRATVPADILTELLRKSGYLRLRPDVDATPIFAHTRATEQLAVDTVHRGSAGSLLGHFSCLRVYAKTWLYHQLATVERNAESYDCRRALYLDVVDWVSLLAGADGFSLAYYDRRKAWHERFINNFVDWVTSDQLAVLAPLDRFERSATPKNFEPIPAGMTFSPLCPEDSAQAAAFIARWLPRLLIEAMDLTESLIARDLTCEALYREEGYERGRHPFALRSGDGIVGVALCEVGSRELSLFNLLNSAQVFIEPNLGAAAEHALLSFVTSFYEERRIPNPIVVSPPGLLVDAAAAGLSLVETMGTFATSALGLKQYRNFLSYQFGSKAAELLATGRGTDPPARR